MPGVIFDIQNYAIYDGPGIRTCVYFKGCPLRCQWCHNPESQLIQPEMAYWRERCGLCGKCVEACKINALSLDEDGVIRKYEKCETCGACAKICPNEAMEKVGYETTADDIVGKVLMDKIFFENSGGGVTISGGEPTHQKKFLFEVLEVMKDADIHTAIETCGYFSPQIIDRLLEKVDLFLFDIKHIDPYKHKEATGVENKKILENFSVILNEAGSDRVIPRIPLIPGFNTDGATIDEIVSYLREKGYSGSVHLMPYHSWAKGKYDRLGRGDSFNDPGKISEAEIDRISRVFTGAGMETQCYG